MDASEQPNGEASRIGGKVGAGRYTLIRFLGQGGMGQVWLAQDERLGEQVALKFLTEAIRVDAEALEDMRRETLKSRKLSHPNIIRVHDLFEAEGEAPFISMEFIEGAALNILKAAQPDRLFSWEKLRPLAQQMCSALAYAHDRKIVHRDLKPGNMIVDQEGVLKLADFGLAASASDSVSRLTHQVGTSGTPAYMSPQQMNSQAPRPADDIYAFGATLYELLTSKPPFYTGDIFRQVQESPPVPLPERLGDLGLVNDVPADVAAMVLACLAKDPGQRPASIRDIADWIGLELDDGGVRGLPAGPTKPAVHDEPEAEVHAGMAEAGPRFSWGIILGAVTVLAILAVVVVLVMNRQPEPAPPPVVKKPPAPSAPDQLAELQRQLKQAGMPGNLTRNEKGWFMLYLRGSPTSDLRPLKGIPINGLDIGDCTRITDLTPINGLPLKELRAGNTGIENLYALKGMELVTLEFQQTKVSDLEPLRGMPLESLRLDGCTNVTDFRPLMGMPLQQLIIESTKLASLDVLRGAPLERLLMSNTLVTDLSPLAGAKLNEIILTHTSVADIQVLAGMPLFTVAMQGCPLLRDVSPLTNCARLKQVELPLAARANVGVLRNHPSIEHITFVRQGAWENVPSPVKFWEAYDRSTAR